MLMTKGALHEFMLFSLLFDIIAILFLYLFFFNVFAFSLWLCTCIVRHLYPCLHSFLICNGSVVLFG